MKIAVFFPDTFGAAWSLTHGLVDEIERQGHQVATGKLPVFDGEVPQAAFELIKESLPALETLKKCDAIIVSGPEHIAPWLDAVYGKYEWKNIDVPKAAWWHESMFRDDYTLDWDSVGMWANENFVPAYQDADWLSQEMFGGNHVHWLPFGVDTKVFADSCKIVEKGLNWHHHSSYENEQCEHARCYGPVKTWPVAFVGQVYEKRQKFLAALSKCNIPPIRLGNVKVQDLAGLDPLENVQRLASNYRRVGVFFNLPAMSRLLVTKIYEVMACGTFVLTPLLSDEKHISENMKQFHDREHLVYYRSANLVDTARALRHWTEPENLAKREEIAAAGCREVHEKHNLRVRLETILEKIGVREAVQ